ncbi:MAG: 50S ribosomal protein L29 [Candidatus Taylorbacteria bacterium RIFCSPHIGHO2_01_FULL_51_15]|uniref:Large ribosomal subunit protein uL29 n=1 Tax=Candidatus Taylorbacteria bacterium RIFCSPHIGHO2_01_FULL_51_15 TaxID=1802304 RepID=A0A1G2MEC4_9BACT|nr:MAG: 50S ribosomal protein L29 [Candidatus Taylorbacteria bacterium RIFCSPHIGHO2_01_FULL_51_15]
MSEYAKKTKEELDRLVRDHREKLQAFRFAITGSKAKNTKEGRNLRKEIARILTEVQRRTIESRTSNIKK